MTALVREAAAADREAIRSLCLVAFDADEAEVVAELACELLADAGPPPTLSIVATLDEAVVANAAFSAVSLEGEWGLGVSMLAPLAVHPEHQRQGIGSLLVRRGIELVRSAGSDFLLVYGDPAYYTRFGFAADVAERFQPPHALQHPFGWLAMPLGKAPPPAEPTRLRCRPPLCDPGLW